MVSQAFLSCPYPFLLQTITLDLAFLPQHPHLASIPLDAVSIIFFSQSLPQLEGDLLSIHSHNHIYWAWLCTRHCAMY